MLERLWGAEPLPYRSWSVHAGPQPLEREFWRRRDVEVVDMAPAAYVAELERVGSGRTRPLQHERPHQPVLRILPGLLGGRGGLGIMVAS